MLLFSRFFLSFFSFCICTTHKESATELRAKNVFNFNAYYTNFTFSFLLLFTIFWFLFFLFCHWKLEVKNYHVLYHICNLSLLFFVFASACCCVGCIKVIIIVYSKDMSTCWSLALAYALCLCATSWAISLSWFGICLLFSLMFFV